MKIYSLQKNKAFTRTPKFGVTPKGGGFTLVETLVSISIFTMSILGLMSILASGISNTNYAKKKMAAEYLAQEGIECVRNIRDTYVLYPDATHSWSNFTALGSFACPTYDSSFSRSITNSFVSSDERKITSTVTWNQGSVLKSVSLSENLFNWIE